MKNLGINEEKSRETITIKPRHWGPGAEVALFFTLQDANPPCSPASSKPTPPRLPLLKVLLRRTTGLTPVTSD